MECGLLNLMEDFILKEVDYSQQHGYSSRAKRYMRRKLNQELAPYINDSDDELESILLPQTTRLNTCVSFLYIFMFGTFYTTTMYIVYTYSNSCP
jgi:hypothetical protein